MEISKVNQTSFGAKYVLINDTVSALKSKTVTEVREFLPEAYKAGDNTIGLSFHKESGKESLLVTASKLIQKAVLPEKRTIIGKLIQKISRVKPEMKDFALYKDTQKIFEDEVNQQKLSEVTQLAISNVEDQKLAVDTLKLAKEDSSQAAAAKLL